MSDQEPKKPPRPAGSLLGARALLSKQLGSSSSSPGRLPSLRPARDLTLGATPKLTLGGATKRTFTPNIPTRRIKDEPATPAKDHSHKPKPQGRGRGQHGKDRGSGRGRGQGRGRGKPELVSSASVFSMGPADRQRAGQVSSTTGFAGGSKGGERRTVVKTENKSDPYDDEETKRILSMLNTGNEDSADENQEYGMAPVQIPLAQYRQRLEESSPALLPEEIKDEPMEIDSDDVEIKKPIKPKRVKVPVKTEKIDIPCSTLFSAGLEDAQEKLMFFQFPDKLPIKPTAEEVPMNTDQTEDDKDTKKTSKADKKLSLKDVSEGYIGKLQILKSGKARLVLGDVTLDVAMGTSCSFLQDLVSIHTDEQRSDMTVLGHLQHRLICTPDYERLLAS